MEEILAERLSEMDLDELIDLLNKVQSLNPEALEALSEAIDEI